MKSLCKSWSVHLIFRVYCRLQFSRTCPHVLSVKCPKRHRGDGSSRDRSALVQASSQSKPPFLPGTRKAEPAWLRAERRTSESGDKRRQMPRPRFLLEKSKSALGPVLTQGTQYHCLFCRAIWCCRSFTFADWDSSFLTRRHGKQASNPQEVPSSACDSITALYSSSVASWGSLRKSSAAGKR